MENPYMDQERLDFLKARVEASTSKGLLTAWPRDEKELPLVQVDVDWVRFWTNSHRTRAEQRKEIHRTGQSNLFHEDPLGEKAQKAQLQILCKQEGFEALESDLAVRGQREHAVVTAEGIVVNGNRRTAALRSLFHDAKNLDARYLRCLVLPSDATPEEILFLETELQVAKEFKQEYSWINQALLIEELYERLGRDFAKVAGLMHRKPSDIREDYEKIQQVNQLVEMSGGTYLHIDFEPNESAFNELAQHIRNKAEEERDAVRSVYFIGTLSGVNYRDLRHLRRSDADKLVQDEMENDEQLSDLLKLAQQDAPTVSEADNLLDDVLGEAPSASNVHKVLDLLATRDRDSDITMLDGSVVPVSDAFDQVRRVVEKAAEEAAEQKKDAEMVNAPIKRLDRAHHELQRALDTLDAARAMPGWDEPLFQAKLAKVKELMGDFEDDS